MAKLACRDCGGTAYNDISTMELLLAKGADVNAKSSRAESGQIYLGADRWTALVFAVAEGHFAAARLLIEHNADVNAMVSSSQTVLDVAMQHDNPDIADLLRKHGAVTLY